MYPKIRTLRENKGLSVKQLAKIANISRITLRKLETEQVYYVSIKTLYAIANALGVGMSDIFSD